MIHLPGGWAMALLVAAVSPLVYCALAGVAAWRFEAAGADRKLQRSVAGFEPPGSIIKPLRGIDFASYENYRSFCQQDYPDYEILFAVNEEADPAAAVVQRLIADYPQSQIRLLIGAEYFG